MTRNSPRWLAVTACVVIAGCSAAAAPTAAVPPTATSAAARAAAPFVYVANKSSDLLSQFGALRGSGALRQLTPKAVATGSYPTAMAISPQGNNVYVIDTGSFSAPLQEIEQFTVNPATGKLTSRSPTVKTGRGPIWITVAPDGKSAYVADSEADAVSQYSISPVTGRLTPMSPATVKTPGPPVAIAVAPDAKYAYVADVMTDNVAQYQINPKTGALSSQPVSTVPCGRGAESVTIAPDGRSAYVTDTVEGAISQYRITPATGKLRPLSPATVRTGRTGPHDLVVTPDSKNAYVVTVANDTVAQYRISPATGALSRNPASAAATVLHPEVIALSPDGKNAYVTSENKGFVSQYAISPATGKITPLSPAIVTTFSGSFGLAVTPDADLSAKLSGPATARPGQALTYTIKIRSAGPSDASHAEVTDHLPAATAFGTVTTTGGQCAAPHAGTRGATVKCRLGTLKVGATWRIRIKVTVRASHGTIHDQAAVTSVTPDPRPGNNAAAAPTKITR